MSKLESERFAISCAEIITFPGNVIFINHPKHLSLLCLLKPMLITYMPIPINWLCSSQYIQFVRWTPQILQDCNCVKIKDAKCLARISSLGYNERFIVVVNVIVTYLYKATCELFFLWKRRTASWLLVLDFSTFSSSTFCFWQDENRIPLDQVCITLRSANVKWHQLNVLLMGAKENDAEQLLLTNIFSPSTVKLKRTEYTSCCTLTTEEKIYCYRFNV